MNIQYAHQRDMDALLAKQSEARMYIRSDVFRMALQNRWRHYYKEGCKPKLVTLAIQLQRGTT